MTFSIALDALKLGKSVSRQGWNGRGMYLLLHYPQNEKLTVPYIYLVTVNNERVPWVPSQTDILAEDWELA